MEIQAIKDIAGIIAPFLALLIAWRGLSTWRRQLHVTRNSDLAKRILVALYKVEAAIDDIRCPIVNVIIPKGEEREPKALEQNWAKQYEEKWHRLTDILADLQAGIIEAKAIWDRDFPDITKDLFVCISELHDCLYDHLQHRLDEDYVPLYETKEARAVIYARGSQDKDLFGKKIKTAIAKIDEAVRRLLTDVGVPSFLCGH